MMAWQLCLCYVQPFVVWIRQTNLGSLCSKYYPKAQCVILHCDIYSWAHLGSVRGLKLKKCADGSFMPHCFTCSMLYSYHMVHWGLPVFVSVLVPYFRYCVGNRLRCRNGIKHKALAILYLCWASTLIKPFNQWKSMGHCPTACLPFRIFGMAALADQSEIFIWAKCLCLYWQACLCGGKQAPIKWHRLDINWYLFF